MKCVFVFVLFSVVSVSAQQGSFVQTKDFVKFCADFNMPIIIPSESIDPKIIIKPVETFDIKIEKRILCSNDFSEKVGTDSIFNWLEKKQLVNPLSFFPETLNQKVEKR